MLAVECNPLIRLLAGAARGPETYLWARSRWRVDGRSGPSFEGCGGADARRVGIRGIKLEASCEAGSWNSGSGRGRADVPTNSGEAASHQEFNHALSLSGCLQAEQQDRIIVFGCYSQHTEVQNLVSFEGLFSFGNLRLVYLSGCTRTHGAPRCLQADRQFV